MDELLRELNLQPDATSVPTVVQLLVATLLAFVLARWIAWTHRVTHPGPSYSPGMGLTLVLMAVITAGVMLVIGSNLARAFSLVGAMSVIRFRSAVKDPRDVAFLYFAMVVGMAAGTMFLTIAAAIGVIGCGVAFYDHLRQPKEAPAEVVLRVVVEPKAEVEQALTAALAGHLEGYTLLAAELAAEGATELVYSATLVDASSERLALDAIRATAGVRHATISRGLHLHAV